MRQLAAYLLLVSLPFQVEAGGRKLPKAPDKIRTTLPDQHPYQQVLRKHLASLTEKDFTHGVTEKIQVVPADPDPEFQYRNHLLTLMPQPLVGTKRGAPAVNAPPRLFTLASIERPEGVHTPPVWPEPLIAFVNWKYPGNPYYHNRALKLRAFVKCTIQLVMMDDQLEHHPERGGSRADWFGNQLIILAQPYPGFKDVLPADVQKAYETGLRRMGERVFEWGPEGEEPNLEIVSVLGLWYTSQALRDAAFARAAEAYARRICTDPRFFHQAGFFLDNRGIDVGYQGMTNFFLNGIALASDWPFAKDVVDRCYRLRAHLCLPEPEGGFVGPSHFNSRTSSDAWGDQWEWGGARDHAAALATEHALYLTKALTPEELRNAPARRAGGFQQALGENPVGKGGFLKNEQIDSHLWRWSLWQSFNFPGTINFGHEHYPIGAYQKLHELQKNNSPLLKSPFLREQNFVRDFAKAFTVARQPTYAAIVHSGPIGWPGIEDGTFKFAGPLGFGGGQLSAFWTPDTGAVLLGRRGGNSWDKTFDHVEDWRAWPIHAVSGCKHDGKVFTSARIRQPDVASDVRDNKGSVEVSGVLPHEQLGQGKVLEGRLTCTRTFKLEADAVHIETRLHATGQDKIVELYETLPVFIHAFPKAPQTSVSFQVNGQWQPAATEFVEGVQAIKLSRSKGDVHITFDRPQRLKLGSAWTDTYLSRAKCQNIQIDLLQGTTPQVVHGNLALSYRIAGVAQKK